MQDIPSTPVLGTTLPCIPCLRRDAFQLACWSQRGKGEDSGAPGLPSGRWKKKKVSGLGGREESGAVFRPDLYVKGTALCEEEQPCSQPRLYSGRNSLAPTLDPSWTRKAESLGDQRGIQMCQQRQVPEEGRGKPDCFKS